MSEPIAGLQRVTKRFDATVALRDVSLNFEGGRVHALLGENGSGKSTAVKVLSGVLAPDGGTVTVDGKPVQFHSPRDGIQAGIAATYQETALVPQLSIADNLVLGREPTRMRLLDRRRAFQSARYWLREVGLELDPRLRAGDLSVASQQLLNIAKALSLSARLFIFDEPTASLTHREVDRLFELIGGLRERGFAIVYITHRLAEVEKLADVITVLKDGQIVRTLPASEANEATIVPLMVGREVGELFPQRRDPDARIVLEATHLVNDDGTVSVPSLRLRAGEIVGVAGLDGSGRSTLVHLLAGVERRRSGELSVRGRLVSARGVGAALNAGVVFTPADRLREGTVPTFSVASSITYASLHRFVRLGFLRRRAERAAASRHVEQLGIRTSSLDAPVRTLSGGNQQKVVLARVLCAGGDVLVCDEPTAGIDVGAKHEIYALLADLARNGMSIVLSSSDMLELIGLCHRILVMREGKLVQEFDARAATEQALMRAQLPEGRQVAA